MCLGYLLTVNTATQNKVVPLSTQHHCECAQRDRKHFRQNSTCASIRSNCTEQVMPQSESVFLWANKVKTTTSRLWNRNKCGTTCGFVVEPKKASKCDADPQNHPSALHSLPDSGSARGQVRRYASFLSCGVDRRDNARHAGVMSCVQLK